MSTLFILIIAAWTALVAVAFVLAVAQAILHFLPAAAPRWQAPLAPTLAEERAA
jgi:hypothetical protein